MFLQITRCDFFLECGIRKTLEKLRPPSVTELLLSYNGDQILEGSATNFFVVIRKVGLFYLSAQITILLTRLFDARILCPLVSNHMCVFPPKI
jgi:hypothetical protein